MIINNHGECLFISTILLNCKTEQRNNQYAFGQLIRQSRGIFCRYEQGGANSWGMGSLFEAYFTNR